MSQPTEYKNKFALSQSAIKDWKEMSPKKWYDKWILKNRTFRTSDSLEFGNLLDTLMFSQTLFDKRFILFSGKKPTEKVSAVVNAIFTHILGLNNNAKELNEKNKLEKLFDTEIPIKEFDLTLNKDIVQKFCLELEHYAGQLERAFNEIVKHGTEYFDFLKIAQGRIVITDEILKLAKELKEILLNDPVSRGFFIAKKDCEVLFQVQMFADFELSGFESLEVLPIKGILDIVHFNHKRKEAREVDLKFTSDTYKFFEPIRRFDYPLQHSLYDYLIHEWLKTYNKGKYKDYTVCNPINVVIDDQEKIPYLYGYCASDLEVKRFGLEGTKIVGWEDTIKEIAWHLDNNKWERPKAHYLNGFIPVQIYKK